jgi:two-component system NtrC family sensor kinase
MDPEIVSVDLNDLIEEVLGFLELEVKHRNIQLELDLAPDLPAMASDRGQLQQVFLNLVNNSLDAVADGGRVVVRTRAAGAGALEVAVEDNGVGMTRETLQQIFEPFFTTKEQGEGTGLGLSITYGIVRRLGGEIDVKSTPGEGTTFAVMLPVRKPEEV